MGLTSALYTGLSGLSVNQSNLNVIGNNIANSNTTAFKSSRALFSSQFYVTDQSSTAPTTDFGGTNPDQEGQGAQVDSITQNWTPGTIQSTGQPTDLALDGQGFFVVHSTTGQVYTRDGSFSLNSSNQLVDSKGDYVQGYGADTNGNIVTGAVKNITIPLGTTTSAQATTNVVLQGNLDASGAPAIGASILESGPITTIGGAAAPTAASLLTSLASTTAPGTPLFTAGDVLTLNATRGGADLATQTFTVTSTSTVTDLTNFYNQGMGIDTSVADTPPPGAAIQADPTNPNAAEISITGNTGTVNALAISTSGFTNQSGVSPLSFTAGQNAAGVQSNPSGESVQTSFVAYDSLGTPVTLDVTAVMQSQSTAGNTWRFYVNSADNQGGAGTLLGDGTLTFNSAGQLATSTGTNISLDRTGTGAASPLNINLNFNGISQLSGSSSNLVMTSQDGSPIGTLNNYSIGADGIINGSYSNGLTRTLGQVAVATFGNEQGLQDMGDNQYEASPSSGDAVVTTAGQLGTGAIRSGALEESNVDLSQQFVNMIEASTGYSASSRVISTSNQLLTDLLNIQTR